MSQNIGRVKQLPSPGKCLCWDTEPVGSWTQTCTWEDTFITWGSLHHHRDSNMRAGRAEGLGASVQRLEKGCYPCPRAVKKAPHRALNLCVLAEVCVSGRGPPLWEDHLLHQVHHFQYCSPRNTFSALCDRCLGVFQASCGRHIQLTITAKYCTPLSIAAKYCTPLSHGFSTCNRAAE